MASDFIQIGDVAIGVKAIAWIDFADADVMTLATVDMREGEHWTFKGPQSAAFRTWWETKASVNVLYVEPDEDSPT